MNVFTDMAINKRKIEYYRKYIRNLEAKNLHYDFTITNSKNDLEKLCKLGVSKNKIYNLGSLRFEKSWLKILSNITKTHEETLINRNKPIILILLNKLMYKGSAENIKKMIDVASQFGTVLVKPHTRNMKIGFIKDLIKKKNIILVDKYNTSYLIFISNIIVFWGTSMGVQAVLQGRPVIYAKLAHKLKTVYEPLLKNMTANTIYEFKNLIKNMINKKSKIRKRFIPNKKLIMDFQSIFSNGGEKVNSKIVYLKFINRLIK